MANLKEQAQSTTINGVTYYRLYVMAWTGRDADGPSDEGYSLHTSKEDVQKYLKIEEEENRKAWERSKTPFILQPSYREPVEILLPEDNKLAGEWKRTGDTFVRHTRSKEEERAVRSFIDNPLGAIKFNGPEEKSSETVFMKV